jgi:pyrroline-5-carboxylate reductase
MSAAAGRVLLIGGGKMGGALAAGWLNGMLTPDQLIIVEPNEAAASELGALGATLVPNAGALPGGPAPSVIVYAVKPQIMPDALPDYAGRGGSETVHLSIAAGCPIGLFVRHLGAVPVVRAMPNTPAAIGHGMTVLCANAAVTAEQRDICGRLLAAVGAVDWIDDEALMDAVTAVSGSGPAYVFWLAECLAEAGTAAGLPVDLARRLAEQTVSGAGALLEHSSETASVLRRNVTSPGGTTEAALKVLMAEEGLAPLMIRAVRAATERSRALAR